MSSRQVGDSGANNQTELLRDVDQMCDRFEAAWSAGQNPRIEDFIEGVTEPLKSRLLRELVALEVAYRRQSGQTPDRAEYETRFPSDTATVREGFGCSTPHTSSSAQAETELHASSDTPSGHLDVRCPSCHTPMQLAVDTVLTELTCASCGSHFSLVDQGQTTRMAPPLSTLGRFELTERLGVGGFGSVWKARDKELDRTVAIKIPRQGTMTAQEQDRFFQEARAAAQLRHANIVSVHEVGREDDTIYIVSDFVRGVTLGDWLTGQQLTSREAAELCAKIANAIHHAHEAGVVHRDLKPANIMIDGNGEPHLMDFGLARREVGEVTVTLDGQVLGTPAYMSPEQAQGEAHQADRRSDVYSLGVILFQLLTGELPFRGNARMLIHQVINDEPPSPRKLNANVSKDLETICLKCLEKDPGRRYPTAREFGDELRRFLAGEPINARPIGRAERAARWIGRHKTVSALSAAVALALVTGTMVSTYFAVDAQRHAGIAVIAGHAAEARREEAEGARRDAEERQREAEGARVEEAQARKEAEAVSSFLVKALTSPSPADDGHKITVAEVLDRAADNVEQDLRNQPLVQAALLNAIGEANLGLGRYKKAIDAFSRAVDLRKSTLGKKHPHTLWSMGSLALVYQNEERLEEAISLLEQTVAGLGETLGEDHPYTLAQMKELGGAYLNAGRLEEATTLLEKTLAKMREKLGKDHPCTLASMGELGRAYRMAGRNEEAISLLERALATMREKRGEDYPSTLTLMTGLSRAYRAAGRNEEAISLLGQVLAGEREKLGEDHPSTLGSMSYLGWVYLEAGRLEEAISLLEQTVVGMREKFGENHRSTLTSMGNLSRAYQEDGRFADAARIEVRRITRSNLAPWPRRGDYLRLFDLAVKADDDETALKAADEMVQSAIELSHDNPHLAVALLSITAQGLNQDGRWKLAERLGRAANALADQHLHENHPFVGRTKRILDNAIEKISDGKPNYASAKVWRPFLKPSIDDLRISMASEPDNVHHWHFAATAALGAGETQAYQKICREMLDHFRDTDNKQTAGRIGYACVSAPDSTAEPEEILRLARMREDERPGSCRLVGAALYRTGKYEAALEKFDQAATDGFQFLAWDHAFMAMALHRLGRLDEAAASLDKARQLFDQVTSWNEEVEVGSLIQEAKALLQAE